MFWIHGGGYSGGASSEPRHNGDFLPLKGVVLVTINYRLGVFGFLATSDLAKEANGAAGNYGLLDMVAALQWVKANIKNFGGDPDNVTIFGESAGSFAVSTLMASPRSRGLFHKAIGESGAAFSDTLPTDTLEAREKQDAEWVASLGVTTLAELRALPTDKVLDAAKNKKGGFWPVVDGKFLTEPVADTYAAGKQAHVPLLAGWNRDEGSFFAMRPMTAEQFKGMIGGLYKERAAEFLKLYPADTDAQALRSAIDYGSDNFIAFGTWKWIEAHRKTGDSPVYRYHLELAAPPSKYHPGSFAFHSDDIEYVFGTLDTRPGAVWRPEDRTLSEQMMSYWTNFAKHRRPQRTRPARVAQVRQRRLAHPPGQHHHLRPGHPPPALRVPAEGNAGVPLLKIQPIGIPLLSAFNAEWRGIPCSWSTYYEPAESVELPFKSAFHASAIEGFRAKKAFCVSESTSLSGHEKLMQRVQIFLRKR